MLEDAIHYSLRAPTGCVKRWEYGIINEFFQTGIWNSLVSRLAHTLLGCPRSSRTIFQKLNSKVCRAKWMRRKDSPILPLLLLLWTVCLCPPEFICWNSDPRCYRVWRWCLWEVSRVSWGHEGGVLLMALVPFQKRKRDQSSSPLPHGRTQWEGDHLQARKIALPRIRPW